MKQIAVIGAGQLGSRHLQGLLKYLEKLNIYVLDPSLESLKVSKERENEITHIHEVIYTQNWQILPKFLNLVIVATNSNVRESVINELISNCKVDFLILEKVLFPELQAYERVYLKLQKSAIKTYVNHPRRMFESYKKLKGILKSQKNTIFNVIGGNWGFGCNALHFLDLFTYLTEEKLIEFSIDSIDNELRESSRNGFVEFTGTITGKLSGGSLFSISSFDDNASPITMTILNNDQRFLVQEGGTPKIYEISEKNSFDIVLHDFAVEYQSTLTYKLISELFENGTCNLPMFEEARITHELFIDEMLVKFNKIKGEKSTILPIT